ncbi:MAG: DUF1295 domain-containing protein [Promethearchaeia archaeon]
MREKQAGLIVIVLTYVLAFFAAWGVGFVCRSFHPLLIVLASDIAATLVVFLISTLYKNTSIYDPYWSVAPIVIALYYFICSPFSGTLIRKIFVLPLITVWGIRLTGHWAKGWGGLQQEDWRYSIYREQYKKHYWIFNLFGLQLMPTIMVYLGCLSLYPALYITGASFNIFDITGIIITAAAIIIETVADKQLTAFIKEKYDKEKIMKWGLWHYSRHPNYFGEILFWFGLYFFALATDIRFWWTIIGPLSIFLLFYFVSIPLMDERNLARRANYEQHMRKVSKLIPLPPQDGDKENKKYN